MTERTGSFYHIDAWAPADTFFRRKSIGKKFHTESRVDCEFLEIIYYLFKNKYIFYILHIYIIFHVYMRRRINST